MIDFDLTQAGCLEADPEIFFVDNQDEPEYSKGDTEAAIAICRSCLVKVDCLEFALKEKAIGVWGGTTTNKRKVMLDRISRGKPLEDQRKGNRPENLNGMNEKRQIEKGATMAKNLIKALQIDDGWASEATLLLAKIKIDNPAMSYSEIAAQTGFTRSQVSNNLQRFIRRINA
jgi:WhiB family redox-sensing transcriptional regulator